jgi:hypothetical protein
MATCGSSSRSLASLCWLIRRQLASDRDCSQLKVCL